MAKNKDYITWLEAALDVIGGKRKPLIIFALENGALRYSEIAHRMTRITESMLVRQLRELERDGLVTRTVYPEVPPKVEYALTPSGKRLIPALRLISLWSASYLDRDVVGGRLPPVVWRKEWLIALRDDLTNISAHIEKNLMCISEP